MLYLTAIEICKKLCCLGGTAGDETECAKEALKMLEKFMPAQIDKNGNVIGLLNENAPYTVALEAHIDMVGLVVTQIDENGFIHFDKVGGTDIRTLVGSSVTVYGKRTLNGVVCSKPPHLISNSEKDAEADIKNLAVDIGFDEKQAKEIVSVGDRMVVSYNPQMLLSNKYTSCALDDRSGVAAILLALKELENKVHNLNLTVIFSCGEEVGGFGAKTAAYTSNANEAICVDVGFGSDRFCSGEGIIDLGKGPSIGLSPVLDRDFVIKLEQTAEECNIPYQHDVMSGLTGTNADKFTVSKGGIKTALLSIPLRNMHTPVEVIDNEDINLTAKLISSYILKKEAELNA